jgi:phosphatidylglycerophosphatase A
MLLPIIRVSFLKTAKIVDIRVCLNKRHLTGPGDNRVTGQSTAGVLRNRTIHFKSPKAESTKAMNQIKRQLWEMLSFKERILSFFVLILIWGGIAAALLLGYLGLLTDPGSFFWGEILGSLLLAYLALLKPKMDIVALMTPLYALIIFMGLEIPVNLLLQVLFAGSLTILLYRLHMQFSRDERVTTSTWEEEE